MLLAQLDASSTFRSAHKQRVELLKVRCWLPSRPAAIGVLSVLQGKSAGDVYDYIVAECAKRGIVVLMDMHCLTCKSSITPLWYTDEFPEDQLIHAWCMVASRSAIFKRTFHNKTEEKAEDRLLHLKLLRKGSITSHAARCRDFRALLPVTTAPPVIQCTIIRHTFIRSKSSNTQKNHQVIRGHKARIHLSGNATVLL